MVTGQHQATGSAHEHRATTTRAAAPTSKTLTPPHPRSVATPTKETSGKVAPLHTPGRPPAPRPKGPAQKRPPSLVLLHRVQDKLSPATRRETRPVLLPGARQARSCCRARDELCLAATGARRAMDRNWERSSPMTRVEPGRLGKGSKVEKGRSPTADAALGDDQPPP